MNGPPLSPQPPAPQPPKQPSGPRKLMIAGAAAVALAATIAIGASGESDPSTDLGADPSPAVSVDAAVNVDSGEQAAQEAAASEAAASEAAASEAAEAEASAAAAAVLMDPANYTDISARDWELLSRDPDAHVGEMYQIYGYVSQFDSSTGPTLFRANTGGDQESQWYNYDINTIVTAANDPDILARVLTDDIFVAYVQVVGVLEYDTTIGGTATAVVVNVNMIEVIGTM